MFENCDCMVLKNGLANKLATVAHACNTSVSEAEAGGLGVLCHPRNLGDLV